MKSKLSYHWLIGAFISLFFALQSYSVAHASTYGEAPHEHDGVACAVTVISSEAAIITPAPAVTEPMVSETVEILCSAYTSARYVTSQSRAPPPRGPPNSI